MNIKKVITGLLIVLVLMLTSCGLFVKKYTVTVTVSPEGAGETVMDPFQGSYKAGTRITIHAGGNEGYRFSRFSGDIDSSEMETSFIIEKDMRITAEFIPVSDLTVTIDGEGTVNQTVVSTPGRTLYDTGTAVELEAVPEDTYAFQKWSGGLSGSENPAEITVDSDMEVTAHFVPKWTVMVYLDADNNLEAAGLEDINEMEAADLREYGINVIVLMDRIAGYTSADGDWTGTRLYKINYDSPTVDTVIRSARLASAELGLSDAGDNDELNMGDPETLESFISFCKSEYPAENYFLILWNHGSGWKDVPPGEQPHLPRTLQKGEFPQPPPPNQAVCFDDTSDSDPLYTAEVGEALSGKGISVVGFDACLMAMIEVAYEIRNHSSYMIGSQETEPGDGWEYDYFLENFIATPMDTPDLLSSVTDAYEEQYGGYAEGTLSAVDLSKVDDFMTAYDAFCDTLYASITDAATQTLVQDALWDAEYFWDSEYGGDHNVDIWSFADEIQAGSDMADAEAAAVKTAVENMVAAEWHNTGHPGAKGLNIHNAYFFNDYSYGYWISYTAGYPASLPVSFVNDSAWPGTYDEGTESITGPGLIYRIWFEEF